MGSYIKETGGNEYQSTIINCKCSRAKGGGGGSRPVVTSTYFASYQALFMGRVIFGTKVKLRAGYARIRSGCVRLF